MLFWKWKSTDTAIMTMDLQHITCLASIDELVERLCSVFDLHATVKTCEINFSCSACWFTHYLQEIKTAGCVLERCFRCSGLAVYKLAFPPVKIKGVTLSPLKIICHSSTQT